MIPEIAVSAPDYVCDRDHPTCIDARITRGFGISASREQISTVDRSVQDNPSHYADQNQQNEGHRNTEKISICQKPQEVQTADRAESFRLILGDEARQSAINQQTAQRDNEE